MGEVRITIKDVESGDTRGVVFAVSRAGEPGLAHAVADVVLDGIKDMMQALQGRGAVSCAVQEGAVSASPDGALAQGEALFAQKAAEIAMSKAAKTN